MDSENADQVTGSVESLSDSSDSMSRPRSTSRPKTLQAVTSEPGYVYLDNGLLWVARLPYPLIFILEIIELVYIIHFIFSFNATKTIDSRTKTTRRFIDGRRRPMKSTNVAYLEVL